MLCELLFEHAAVELAGEVRLDPECISISIPIILLAFPFLNLLQPEATNADELYHSSGLGEDRVSLGMQLALYLDPHRSAALPASIQVRARAVHVSSLDDTS